MWNMYDVISLEYKHSYIFHIVFDNGVSGDIDFYEYLEKGPIFRPLKKLISLNRPALMVEQYPGQMVLI